MSDLDNTALQEKVNEIVTTENERLLQKKEIIDQEIDGKDRLRVLNRTTRKRGEHITQMVLVFVIVLCAYTFLKILSDTVTIIPSFLFDILNFVLVAIGIIYIFTIFVDMLSRDRLYYDKFVFEHPNVDTPEEVQQKHQARLQQASSLCEGSACCPGTVAGQPVYDAALNLCVNSQDSFANMKMKNKVKPTPSNKPNEFEDYAKV